MLLSVLRDRMVTGLRRSSIDSASKWAEMYRVIKDKVSSDLKPWSFKWSPWTRDIHDDRSDFIVGQKAAQMGYTEAALNRTFYAIDILRDSVMYILPAESPDAKDFSSARFDPALEASEHLKHLFSDAKNIGHKRAGSCSLFIRGSRSRSQLKSVPAAHIILDELDEMCQENISLAFERVSGQMQHSIFMLSTPTIPDKGINTHFKDSDQRHYCFKCPSCSKLIELTPDCLVIIGDNYADPRVNESYLRCPECKGILPHSGKMDYYKSAIWVPTKTNTSISGYHISQLYSFTITPGDLAKATLKAMIDPTAEEELYNSKYGLPHIVKGSRVSDENITACTKVYTSGPQPRALTTMGVDVGKRLHVEIDQWFPSGTNSAGVGDQELAHCRLLYHGCVDDFYQLDALANDYKITFAVIDANPERREALKFAQRLYGRVRLCFYGNGCKQRAIVTSDDEPTVTVDRTGWLDLSLSRFKNATIDLPVDLSIEYQDHVKSLIRRYDKDRDGNQVGRYVCADNKNDHFAHARNYSEIAFSLAYSLVRNGNISKVY